MQGTEWTKCSSLSFQQISILERRLIALLPMKARERGEHMMNATMQVAHRHWWVLLVRGILAIPYVAR
jgi:hypothetical protein